MTLAFGLGSGPPLLVCNNQQCGRALEQGSEVALLDCGHVLCIECTNQEQDAGHSSCKVCGQSFSNSTMRLIQPLQPSMGTAKYLDLFLQHPNVVLNQAIKAINFFTNQQTHVAAYWQSVATMMDQQLKTLDSACREKLQKVHDGYKRVKRKYVDADRARQELEAEGQELATKYNEAARVCRKYKERNNELQEEVTKLRHELQRWQRRSSGGGGSNGGTPALAPYGLQQGGGMIITHERVVNTSSGHKALPLQQPMHNINEQTYRHNGRPVSPLDLDQPSQRHRMTARRQSAPLVPITAAQPRAGQPPRRNSMSPLHTEMQSPGAMLQDVRQQAGTAALPHGQGGQVGGFNVNAMLGNGRAIASSRKAIGGGSFGVASGMASY